VAYHIKKEKVAEVREYLDIREINGYSIQYTAFHPADATRPNLHCLVYIGMPDNPQFLGALSQQEVASKINESVGPSGENREYLLQLDEALQTLSPSSHDEHISDLAERVRSMTPPVRDLKASKALHHDLTRVGSTEEQEEIEKAI
jgi:glutathione-specific gamma-glutamylcyclotransferase